jgi:hypothetical protein
MSLPQINATTYEIELYPQDTLDMIDNVLEAKILENTQDISYSEEEQLVMCLSYAEAYNQGIYGQQLVMEVVRNRMQSERFPDTFSDVILANRQFAVVKNDCVCLYGKKLEFDEVITDDMKKAFDEVMAGSNDTEELLKQVAYEKGYTEEKYWKGGALFYSNLDTILEQNPEQYEASKYDSIKVSVKIGDHTFWRYWG